jgi:hypothetical protein
MHSSSVITELLDVVKMVQDYGGVGAHYDYWASVNKAADNADAYLKGQLAINAREVRPVREVRKQFDHAWIFIGGRWQLFKGKALTFGARCAREIDAEAARNDPLGFYNAVAIRWGGKPFIMQGPPAIFVAEAQPERPEMKPAEQQLELFT